jgi:transcriptional regulator with XRE-family HTH domain
MSNLIELDAVRDRTAANRLRRLREAQSMSLRQLAAEVSTDQAQPITWMTVRGWERGQARVPQRHWSQLAEMFGVSVTHLLGVDRLGEVA